MTASYEDVERWKREAKEKGATHIVSVCDTYDWDDYPVYVMPGEDSSEIADKYRSSSMQRVNEIITID